MLVGGLVGIPVGLMQFNKDKFDIESLSPSILAQLDNYANEKKLNELINESEEKSYIMTLDTSGKYYTGILQYEMRTDAIEDAELVAKYMDIFGDSEIYEKYVDEAGYDGELSSVEGNITYTYDVSKQRVNPLDYLNIGNDITAGLSEELLVELENISVENGSANNKDNQAYVTFTYTIKYLDSQQMDNYMTWFDEKVRENVNEYCGNSIAVKFRNIKSDKKVINSTEISVIKQQKKSEIAERLNSVDIEVEKMLTGYATTIAPTATMPDGKQAIITTDEKAQYKVYWDYINGNAKRSEGSIVSIIKWMIIMCVVLAFVGVAILSVSFFIKPQVVSEEVIRDIYNLDVIAYVDEGRKEVKGLDKLFTIKGNNMSASSWEYCADVMAEDCQAKSIILVKDCDVRNIESLVDVLKAKGISDVVAGSILEEKDVLCKAREVGCVYIIAELNKSQVGNIEAELHTLEMNGIKLGGVIMV